jgi:hypothetical protein
MSRHILSHVSVHGNAAGELQPVFAGRLDRAPAAIPPAAPFVNIRLRDYASPEEIDVVIAALQLCWRELSARARGANGISE